MDPLAVPGTASGDGIWAHVANGRYREAILSCLHFLTCRICDPPPEVSDSARLALALFIFGGSAALLSAVSSSRVVSLMYFALGLARLLPARGGKSWAFLAAGSALAGLLLLCLPAPLVPTGPIVLILVSELFWLVTLRKVLDDEFDVFVAVLFLFLGVELTFGFYPLLMEWGPQLLESKEVHETVQVVVSHAVKVGQHSGSHPSHPTSMGGGGSTPGSGGEEESQGYGPLIVFSQLLPLLALLVGVPALAFGVLISCWMFEHMSRMVLAVTVSFISWMALYVCLTLLHVRVSRDTFGKAILGSACVLMYHAFSRLTCLDWAAAQMRLGWLGGAFACIFALDQLMVLLSWQSPLLLYTVLVACKLTYSTWANFLEADSRGSLFETDHLVPFRAGGQRREPIMADAVDAATEGPGPERPLEREETPRGFV